MAANGSEWLTFAHMLVHKIDKETVFLVYLEVQPSWLELALSSARCHVQIAKFAIRQ